MSSAIVFKVLATMNIALLLLVGLTYVSHRNLQASKTAECPNQNFGYLTQNATEADISLLFHYVSWSSKANEARLAFDILAEQHKNDGFFAIVDCWHLACNCSTAIRTMNGSNSPHKWPTLIVRSGRIRLHYTGKWKIDAMNRFFENLLRPVLRVRSREDLEELRASSVFVVMAICKNVNSVGYKRIVDISIKTLQYDPERSIKFVIAFGESAFRQYNLDANGLPQLLIFDRDGNVNKLNITYPWKLNEIVLMLHKLLKQNAGHAYGYRSSIESALISQKNAVLTIGLNEAITSIKFLKETSAVLQLKKKTKEKECNKQLRSRCLQTQLTKNDISLNHCLRSQYLSRDILANFYEYNEYWTEMHNKNLYKPNIDSIHLECPRETEKTLLYDEPALKIRTARYIESLSTGLWQNSDKQINESLAVVLIDTEEYIDLFETQLIPHNNNNSIANVFILDLVNESIYVLKESFNYDALKRFVAAFYAGNLQPIKRSQKLPTTAFTKSRQYITNFNRDMLLTELKSHHTNHTNIVLLHTPSCAMSILMSSAFTQLSLLLNSNEMNFIRVDSQSNDLPWELTMYDTPTLILFPQERPAESRIFPRKLKVTVTNMLSFVLSQLQPPIRLRLTLQACERIRHKESCMKFASDIVNQHMEQFLNEWKLKLHDIEYNFILRTLFQQKHS